MVDAGSADPRARGQETYLQGATFERRAFRESDGDHEHCEFCWAKFMLPGPPDTLDEGYVATGWWVCPECFADFRERFAWRVVAKD